MIDNTMDVIDSRDIIEEIERLEGELEDLNEELEELSSEFDDLDYHDTDEADDLNFKILDVKDKIIDLKEELNPLLKLQEEASSSPDWPYGETLIRETYFVEYTEELIDDCYELPKEFNSGDWPWRHMKIDYEAAAEELKQDYFEVDFDGVEYLIRG